MFIASMSCHISRMNLVWGCYTSINQPSPLSKYHCGFTQLFHHVQPLPNDRSKPWRDVEVCTTPLEHGTSTSCNYAGYIWYIELRIEKYCYLTLWNSLGFIKHLLLYSVMQLNTLKLGHVLTHFRHGDSIAVHIQSMTIYRWSLNQGASDQVGSLWIFTWANIISTYFNEY